MDPKVFSQKYSLQTNQSLKQYQSQLLKQMTKPLDRQELKRKKTNELGLNYSAYQSSWNKLENKTSHNGFHDSARQKSKNMSKSPSNNTFDRLFGSDNKNHQKAKTKSFQMNAREVSPYRSVYEKAQNVPNKKVGVFSPLQKDIYSQQNYNQKSSQKLNVDSQNQQKKIIRYDYSPKESRVQDSRPSHKKAYERQMITSNNFKPQNNIINQDSKNNNQFFTTYNEISKHQNKKDEFNNIKKVNLKLSKKFCLN